MILSTGVKDYKIVREVITGKTNDVYICQNQKEPKAPYKTIWIVKDRKIVKTLMENLDDSCEEHFMQNENAGFVFPYIQERLLYKFYLSSIQEQNCPCWQIWLGLVAKCMTSELPAAVVYLILDQDQIHVNPDGTICFGFLLDLSDYDDSVSERENVILCADKILELIRLENHNSAVRMQALRLLEKKLDRKEYKEFIQLYKDIKLISKTDSAGDKKRKRITAFGQDRLYRILSVICIFMVCMVAFMIIGHVFYGEFSFWKLFGSSLDQIGTESLLQ